jgi:hypothetical protein
MRYVVLGNEFNYFFMKINVALLLSLFLFFSCNQHRENDLAAEREVVVDPASVEYMHQLTKSLNDIIVYDIFSAPVASRIYSYSTLAAYESIRWMDTTYPSLTAQLKGFGKMPVPDAGLNYDFRVSGVKAFFIIAQKLTFTKDSTNSVEKRLLDSLSSSSSASIFNRSIDFGIKVADSILARASRDNYKQIQGMPRYSINESKGKWETTPLDYMDAVQPFWAKMAPFFMDSSAQFKPVPPPSFSLEKDSQFYEEMSSVYEISKKLNDSTTEIARFWDDNPSATTHVGHLTYATKKPSPGGHWINITAIASKKTGQNWVQAAQAYAMTSIAMYDAFISCWDEKYRSEYIRPVTAINKLIDANWQPLLQTPPFPEYTSGHSVVSSTIASVLTRVFGDNFEFTDDYEKPYIGIVRSFPSFVKASEEACVSRIYGGIHFVSAVENGKTQGRALGAFINSKVKTK